MRVHRFGRVAAAGLFLTLALGAPAALAHHGWSGYGDEDIVLTGVVEEISLGNPHGHLTVRSEGESGMSCSVHRLATNAPASPMA